jgi:hypothetical protein
VIFDVGAWIGDLTWLFSKFSGPAGRIHAFEPSTDNFEKLSSLCQIANLTNTTINHVAVSDHEGHAEINNYEKGYETWILDSRTDQITTGLERNWCRMYSASHLVIGVHGSNMLIPSGLAGAVIDLIPDERWGNIMQDILFQRGDQRGTLYRYRFLPLQASAETVAGIARSMLLSFPDMLLLMSRETTEHHAG